MNKLPTDMGSFVVALLPSLSESLAGTFNIFQVMHHGTHEKQLSNIFAWLLTADGTHGLGEKFQQAFVRRVNQRVNRSEEHTDALQSRCDIVCHLPLDVQH